MLVGHRVVCYEDATAADVRGAHIVIAAFKNPKAIAHGWTFPPMLERLGLSSSTLVGKVLVHLDDEYGARNPRSDADWRNYCAMYAGWRHVFRNYWSEAWASRVARNHAMNCSCADSESTSITVVSPAIGSARGPGHNGNGPRVEWTPLGWSANWQPAVTPQRASRRTSGFVGFYGNEKYQLRPNRGALMARFEHETGLRVERMLGRVGFGRGNATNYVRLMHDTQLCLQISGLSAECYRMYEALDAGCVPILINQFGKETATQYKFLLGAKDVRRPPPPFPWAESPEMLKDALRRLKADAAALDVMQSDTRKWWNANLAHVRQRVVTSGAMVNVGAKGGC